MSKELNDGNWGVKYETPLNYQENYPVFLEFMDTFFLYLYRQTGFTPGEIQAYLTDTSNWLDPFSDQDPLQQLIAFKAAKTPGQKVKDFLADKFLVRSFERTMAMDYDELQDADGRPLFTPEGHDDQIDGWYEQLGFQRTADKSFQDFGNFVPKDSDKLVTADGYNYTVYVEGTKRRTLDHARWLKLLKHVYAIRGTKKSMELFFWIYFGVPINIYYPKNDIGGLDDNFDLDGTVGLRDDYYYDEFTYVIRVPGDVADFEGVFERVYRQHFHPAGFTVFLESSRG